MTVKSAMRFATSGSFIVSAIACESRVAISGGVFGGATTANQSVWTMPGSVSAIAGASGSSGDALCAGDGQRLHAAIGDMGQDVARRVEDRVDMAGEQVAHRRRKAGIGDVHEADAGRRREPLHLADAACC